MKYLVTAIRETQYEVDGDNAEHAADEMIEGKGREVHGETRTILAAPICPTCKSLLVPTTTREIEYDGYPERLAGSFPCETRNGIWVVLEPTYCETCDREVTE